MTVTGATVPDRPRTARWRRALEAVRTRPASFPASLLACFLIALALERPTIARQAAALAAAALATAFREQGLILVRVAILAVFA